MQQSNFLELVAKERVRQVIEKGYTPEHDDQHTDGSLADAGACYASTAKEIVMPIYDRRSCILAGVHPLWPFEPEYFKKRDHDRKQQLITAAAFINAEYDRIVRLEEKGWTING